MAFASKHSVTLINDKIRRIFLLSLEITKLIVISFVNFKLCKKATYVWS